MAHLRRPPAPETETSPPERMPAPPAARQDVVPKQALFADVDEMKQRVRSALLKEQYSTLDQYHSTGFFQRVARSSIFENVTLFIIAANAIYMAVDTDCNQAPTIAEADLPFQIIEHFFCSYYVVEITVRFMAFRVKRNTLRDSWFVFDALMTLLMVVEDWIITIWLTVSGGTSQSPLKNVLILRIFRLLRLVRMVRMLRSVPELMILLKGMTSALRSVACVLLLLVIINYVFGIAMTQMTSDFDVGDQYFPTVLRSMYTLIISGTFLDNLGMVTDALVAETPVAYAIFMIYIGIALLTVLNILVGVLCEVVSAVAAAEKEEMMVTFVREKMREVLMVLDSNHDMMITKAEFIQVMQQPEAARTLNEVGVDPIGLLDIVNYIYDGENYDGKESPEDAKLSFEDFMEVILKLRGSNVATVKDIVDLRRFVFDSMNSLKVALAGGPQAQRREPAQMTQGSNGVQSNGCSAQAEPLLGFVSPSSSEPLPTSLEELRLLAAGPSKPRSSVRSLDEVRRLVKGQSLATPPSGTGLMPPAVLEELLLMALHQVRALQAEPLARPATTASGFDPDRFRGVDPEYGAAPLSARGCWSADAADPLPLPGPQRRVPEQFSRM